MSAIVSDSGDLGNALVALIGWGVGVAVAGAATAGVTRVLLDGSLHNDAAER
jgi:hypothetical protein